MYEKLSLEELSNKRLGLERVFLRNLYNKSGFYVPSWRKDKIQELNSDIPF